MSYFISFALRIVLTIEQQSLQEWQADLIICQIIHINTNVASALMSHLYIIFKSLNLIDSRVLHTMTDGRTIFYNPSSATTISDYDPISHRF